MNCIKCNLPATLMCARCLDPYCSHLCQRNDWYTHKRICLPLPDLVPIGALISTLDMSSKLQNAEVKSDQQEQLTVSDCQDDVLSNQLHTSMEVPSPQNSSTLPLKVVSPKEDVKLQKEDTNHNESVKAMGLSNFSKIRPLKPESLENSVKRYLSRDLKIIPIQEGKKIPLLIVDTSLIKEFTVCAIDNGNVARKEMAKNLKRVSDYCKDKAKDRTGYSPKVYEVCLAIFDDDKEWYRAIVTEAPPSHAGLHDVQFIDYGNFAEVPSANIMPIPEELMFPTCTNICVFRNIKQDQLPRLVTFIEQNALIYCDVVFVPEKDLYYITLSNADVVLK